MRSIMKKTWPVLASMPTICVIFVGCATATPPPEPTMTPMEIQAMQSREYEEGLVTVFNSVVAVFQDLGYSITAADRVTGFIAAEGLTDSATTGHLSKFLFGSSLESKNVRNVATAFVEPIREITRVRINFVLKENTVTSETNAVSDTAILDPKVYQDAFERVEQEIFVRS